MQTPAGLYLGLMSGTSADGIDIALCEINSVNSVKLLASQFQAYPRELQTRIQALQTQARPDPHELENVDSKLAELTAKWILDFMSIHAIDRENTIAIANHGQTITHLPDDTPPISLQIGNASRIATITGITVIADFRTADLVHGGQGAPLMPAFHKQIFSRHQPCTIVNIGGIANITLLDQDRDTIGFDTGPGNTLLDQWYGLHNAGSFDRDGDWGRSGKCQDKLLNKLLTDPYFARQHPKSTGQDHFNLEWLKQYTKNTDYKPQDIQRTLTQLTATTIVRALSKLGKHNQPLFVCGGGCHNTLLMELLESELPGTDVRTTAEAGVHPDWVEAMGFAWLGYCHLANIKSNLPSVTGAREYCVLGKRFDPAS